MFIARQPIFNKSMKIYGYELLFRADITATSFNNSSSLAATASVLGGLFEQGIENVVGSGKAFVNFDYDFIMSDAIELIDPRTLVIEVLETVQVDSKLVDRLTYLQKIGYKIALDDFATQFERYPIAPISEIIKYDITITPLNTLESEIKTVLSQKKYLLAEKIETEEEFQTAKQMGFHLFQGYFFSKPKILNKPMVNNSTRMQYSRVLQALKDEDADFEKIADIINSDLNLAYKVMRITGNKGRSDAISVRKALIRMGLKEIERWINVLMLQDMAKDKPIEIMKLSLVRSKFSEYIAENSAFHEIKEEISMMCLFSMLDVILDQTMETVLEGMNLLPEVIEALIHGTGPLKPFCQLISAYEIGEWSAVKSAADKLSIPSEILSPSYLKAIRWSSWVISLG